MTTHHGNDGSVAVGANAIAEITGFSVTEQAEVADDSAMGDSWRSNLAGKNAWNGQVSCWHDASDTNGQVALAVGAEVTLNLYPESDATSSKYKTGSARITQIVSSVEQDGIVTKVFTFQGNGALSDATVGA